MSHKHIKTVNITLGLLKRFSIFVFVIHAIIISTTVNTTIACVIISVNILINSIILCKSCIEQYNLIYCMYFIRIIICLSDYLINL